MLLKVPFNKSGQPLYWLSAFVVDFVFDSHDSAIQANLMALAAPIVVRFR